MGIDLPIDWSAIVVVGLIVAGGFAACILAILSYLEWQENRWKRLIDYAISNAENLIKMIEAAKMIENYSQPANTVSDMEEKLESLGQQTVGRDMMGKKLREPNGRFVKQR